MNLLHHLYWVFGFFQEHPRKVRIFIAIGVVVSGGLFGVAITADEEVSTYQEHSIIVTHDQSATITESSDVYTKGEKVSRTYPHNIVSPVTITTTAQEQNARVNSTAIRLVYEVTERQTNSVAYSEQQTIVTAENMSGELNITQVRERIGIIQSEFQQSGQVNVYLDTVVRYSYTTHAGIQNTLTTRKRTPVGSSGTLTVIPFEDASISHTSGTRPSNQPSYAGVFGFVTTTLILLTGVLYRRSAGKASDEWYRIAQRKRYRDWFTRMNHSNVTGNPSLFYSDTLSGLVDIAIEVRERVLWDKDNDEYIVISGDVAYVYGPELDSNDRPAFLSFGFDNKRPPQSNVDNMGFGDISDSPPDIDMDIPSPPGGESSSDGENDNSDIYDGENDGSDIDGDDPFGGYRNK